MKPILLFFLWLIPMICFASELQVTSNTPSGTYEHAVEVVLNSNKENTKILYYTDGIGRFDQLKEFHIDQPIIISKDTTLKFFGIGESFQNTQVQEVLIDFQYKGHFSLHTDQNHIVLSNLSADTQNISYRKIEGEDFVHIFPKNTFIDAKGTLTVSQMQKHGKYILSSPDSQIQIVSQVKPLPIDQSDFPQKANIKEEAVEYIDFTTQETEPIEYIDFSHGVSLDGGVCYVSSETLKPSMKASILESSQNANQKHLFSMLLFILVMGVGMAQIVNLFLERHLRKSLGIEQECIRTFAEYNLSHFGK